MGIIFDEIVADFKTKTARARLTLTRRLLWEMDIVLLRVIIGYCSQRINQLLRLMPDGPEKDALKTRSTVSKVPEDGSWPERNGLNIKAHHDECERL